MKTIAQVNLSEEEVNSLRDYIGDGDRQLTLYVSNVGHSGPGFYIGDTEYPEEGAAFIAPLK